MMVWRTYETYFSASHYIAGHIKCGQTHGHNFDVKVSILGDTENFIDFGYIKDVVEAFLDANLDHRDLGDCTAERIGQLLIDHLTSWFKTTVRVEVKETPKFGIAMEQTWNPRRES